MPQFSSPNGRRTGGFFETTGLLGYVLEKRFTGGIVVNSYTRLY